MLQDGIRSIPLCLFGQRKSPLTGWMPRHTRENPKTMPPIAVAIAGALAVALRLQSTLSLSCS